MFIPKSPKYLFPTNIYFLQSSKYYFPLNVYFPQIVITLIIPSFRSLDQEGTPTLLDSHQSATTLSPGTWTSSIPTPPPQLTLPTSNSKNLVLQNLGGQLSFCSAFCLSSSSLFELTNCGQSLQKVLC